MTTKYRNLDVPDIPYVSGPDQRDAMCKVAYRSGACEDTICRRCILYPLNVGAFADWMAGKGEVE